MSPDGRIPPLELRPLSQHRTEAKICVSGSLGIIVLGATPVSAPLIPGPVNPGCQKK